MSLPSDTNPTPTPSLSDRIRGLRKSAKQEVQEPQVAPKELAQDRGQKITASPVASTAVVAAQDAGVRPTRKATSLDVAGLFGAGGARKAAPAAAPKAAAPKAAPMMEAKAAQASQASGAPAKQDNASANASTGSSGGVSPARPLQLQRLFRNQDDPPMPAPTQDGAVRSLPGTRNTPGSKDDEWPDDWDQSDDSQDEDAGEPLAQFAQRMQQSRLADHTAGLPRPRSNDSMEPVWTDPLRPAGSVMPLEAWQQMWRTYPDMHVFELQFRGEVSLCATDRQPNNFVLDYFLSNSMISDAAHPPPESNYYCTHALVLQTLLGPRGNYSPAEMGGRRSSGSSDGPQPIPMRVIVRNQDMNPVMRGYSWRMTESVEGLYRHKHTLQEWKEAQKDAQEMEKTVQQQERLERPA